MKCYQINNHNNNNTTISSISGFQFKIAPMYIITYHKQIEKSSPDKYFDMKKKKL